jgi:asparagine synthase (glutamine-hydrolysing)
VAGWTDGGGGDLFKGYLGAWGLDFRDPFADRRLTEFCLSVPTDHFLHDGVPRALAKAAFADRLPAAVLNERKIGYQVADWHEGLTAARHEVAAELDRLTACAPAARALDLKKMKQHVENWPSSNWERADIAVAYRGALLDGISAGHFLRKVSGTNR